jgi:uncharacterized protein YbjQ (UPF0145 family)
MAQPAAAPQYPILISTMNDVPGYRVQYVYGEVFGLTVRSRNVFSNFGAGLKAMAGGELKGLTTLLQQSRHEALGRMVQEAMARGANAVIAMRFDCNEIGETASEIAAYGTAVYLVPDGQQPPQPQQQPYPQPQSQPQPQVPQPQAAQPYPQQPYPQQY